MAEIYKHYISDEQISKELWEYHDFSDARRKGASLDKCPGLPQPTETSALKGILGIPIHSSLFIIQRLSHKLALRRIQEWAAKGRIKTDEYSHEPKTCGFHHAYTHLGIAKLYQNDIEAAIKSLYASISIRPCPHSTSFGLSWALRNRLAEHSDAKDAIRKFDIIAKEFGGREWFRQEKQTANKAL